MNLKRLYSLKNLLETLPVPESKIAVVYDLLLAVNDEIKSEERTNEDRYVVRFAEGNEWNDAYWELVDTHTGEVVFDDCMQPEDALLVRDLKPLVVLLNKLAKAQRTNANF